MGHRLPALALAAALFALPAVASAQVADPGCDEPRSTTEVLLETLSTIPLAPGCEAVDVDALKKRLKDAPLGTIQKLRFLVRGKALLDLAMEYDREKKPELLGRLRHDYDDLLGDFLSKIDRDPGLQKDLRCAREPAFTLLLQGAALENAKNRARNAND